MSLKVRGASIAFGEHILFSGLNLEVGRGQLVGISGESGCGKSSLLRALLGFVPFSSGEVEVCGSPLDAAHIPAIRRYVAYVPQELQPPAATGRDLLLLTHDLAVNRSLTWDEDIQSMMATMNLPTSLLNLEAAKLSGGQRQRLLLVAALSLPKTLFLLDEPTSALDAESTQRVIQALLQTCRDRNREVLVVSHNPALLSACDKVITLTP